MTTTVIQDDDKMLTGYTNLPGASMPSIGIKRGKERSVTGLAFNSRKALVEAINFLQKALKELDDQREKEYKLRM